MNTKSNKELDRDSNDKKRRKASSSMDTTAAPVATNSATTSTTVTTSSLSKPSSTIIPKEDIYSSVVKFEELESNYRSAEQDSELFHEMCNDLRGLFGEIAAVKNCGTGGSVSSSSSSSTSASGGHLSEKQKQEIIEKRISGSYMFVVLKKLNRLDKIRLRSGRDALHKEKLSVDSNRLQLQNLLYEAEHLRKEVQRCYQFKSQDEEIDLVDESEFYEKAPSNIARRDKTVNDEHARRLARLEWELQQRKELDAMCKELQKQKELAAKHIESKTDRLTSLAPRLDALLQATRPLQEALDMNIECDWKVKKIARLLPRPLYLVYANLSAYAEACDKHLSTFINGDEFEAKQLEDSEKYGKDELEENKEESDVEDMDVDNERSSKSHHHRRKNIAKLKELKKDNLFKPHPLSVMFKINSNKNTKDSLYVTLHYLPALDIVSAHCNLEFSNEILQTSEVLSATNILTSLNPGDYGEESSNPKTNYQLQQLSLDTKSLLKELDAKQLGKPYKWAQLICGLEFVSTTPATPNATTNDISNKTSFTMTQSSVPQIIKLIRSRWQARLNLYSQIFNLALSTALTNVSSSSSSTNISTTTVSSSSLMNKSNTIISNISHLTKWTSMSWESYNFMVSTQKFIDQMVVSAHDLLYHGLIIRGQAQLDCFICVSVNFPVEMPLWAIELTWRGKKQTALNNSSIREMESWINTIDAITTTSSRKINTNILEVQLKRAQSCLDIYLETETNANDEFPQEKTFLKAFRCRTRSRPYKIIENSGSVVYTQI